MKMGESAGFTFRYEDCWEDWMADCPGALMAACTSRALRRYRGSDRLQRDAGRSRALDEVISVTAAIRPNWRSSGVATDEAMVLSGLAPQTGVHRDWSETPPAAAAIPEQPEAATPANAIAATISVVRRACG